MTAMLNGRETKLDRADRRRSSCAAAVVFELEEELMAWVNRPKAVSSGEPANICPTDLLAIATAADVEEKAPASNVPSPPSSTSNDNISASLVVSGALPDIQNPRVEERSNQHNEISGKAFCDAASRRQEFKPSHSVESFNGAHISRRASPKSVIAHTRSRIKVCFQLAPHLFGRRKSNESVPPAVYLGLRSFKDKSSNNISAAAAAAVEEASKGSGAISIVLETIEETNVEECDEDTRTQQQLSSTSLMTSSFPIWSECSVNVDDGDEYVEEAMTPDAAASYTTRGRQRRRATSPQTDSSLREEESESALHHLNNTHNSPVIHISNLPWRDKPPNGELHGQYSGPINDLLQPHGEGVLALEGNTFLKFYGLWVDGELLTFPGCTQRLLNEDEKRDFEASTRSARILSDTKTLPPQTYGRKLSTIWSECSVNMNDGDQYVEEAMTPDATASYTTRGRQRRRATSPQTDSSLREEESESALHHLNNTHNSPVIHISNLPWRDKPPNGELHGQYSGPINDLLQPHGEGVLALEGNTFLKFYGLWVDGELLTFPGCTQRLLNEDEKRDFEASTRSARILSDTKTLPPQTYGRKFSTEYMTTPSASSASSESLSSAESKTSSSAEFADKSSKSTSRHPPKQKYTLGEVARSPSHMVIYRSKEKAIQSASRLNKYDQAFIKRSNGLW